MEGSSMKKNLLKGIIIIALAVLILLTLNRILILKSEDGISQLKSLYKQNDNTIDVLFLGSSHVYCDISTGVLWDQYGIASYDLGGAEAPAWTSYYHLKEALKTQHPKTVWFEISIAGLRPTDYPPAFWVEDNNYGMKWNENRIELLRANTLEEAFPQLLIPLGPMHGRYADLCEDDFKDINNSINYKGFDPREMINVIDTPDISQITEMEPISAKAEEYLRKIIALCKEENIPLVLFVSPYQVTPEDQPYYNYMFNIGAEEGCVNLDFNKLYNEFGMDFSTDMAESLHLNYSGNYKFSSYIGKILKENYDIPDRRGQAGFESWDIDARNQRIERVDLDLLLNRDFTYWLNQTANEGYIDFVCFDRDGSEFNTEEFRSGFAQLGINIDDVKSGDVYAVRGGQILAKFDGNEEGTFRLAVSNGNERLLLVKEPATEDGETVIMYVNDDVYIEPFRTRVFVYDAILNRYVGTE